MWGGAEKRESRGQTGSAAMWGGGDEHGAGVPLSAFYPSPTHSYSYVRSVCVCLSVCRQGWELQDGGAGLGLVWGPGMTSWGWG